MSKLIRNGLAIADIINDDKALANEVAINLTDEAVKTIIEKRMGVAVHHNDCGLSFKESLQVLLES